MSRPILRSGVRERLRLDLRTAAVALAVCVLAMATPSVAARITNADKVDGKDAVGAGASVQQRKGKLVATDRRGRLPDDIIARAPDAARLDGLGGAAYATRTARRGEVLQGIYSMWGGTANTFVGTGVPFPGALPVAVAGNRTSVVPAAGPFTAECPGPGQVVPNGWLCVYDTATADVAGLEPYNPESGFAGTATRGFGLYGQCAAPTCFSYGSWAVRAGSAADAAARPTRPGIAVRAGLAG